ncbi:MAG: molybdopterin-dependent oxidoreductase, partial [Nitrospinota bacterium]
MRRLALRIDLERCFGCRSCEAACKTANRLDWGQYRLKNLWLDPSTTGGGMEFLNVVCQQCERPGCLRACPVFPKAISRDPETGVVMVHHDLCTGCGECVKACPYGAMGFDAVARVADKCNLCYDRRQQGLGPACASVCPSKAIAFGEREGLILEALEGGRSLRDVDHFLQGPGTVYAESLRPARWEAGALRTVANGGAKFGAGLPILQANGRATRRVEAGFPYHLPRDVAPDRVEAAGCNICFNSCPAEYHFEGGRLIAVTGNEGDPLWQGRVCSKAQTMVQVYNSPHRLRHPLRRVGARGEGKFKRVSWDGALDGLAEGLEEVKERWGAEALAIFVGTRTGILTRDGYSALFAQMFGTPNKESTAPLCATGKDLAYRITQGAPGAGNSFTPEDLGSSDLYLFIGDNMADTRPVYFGMIQDWRSQNRARMMAVDPRLTPTAAKADRWIPIRPGTDMALALAMAHEVITQGWVNRPFVERWVEGYEEVERFILERGCTPAWAAPIADIPEETIRELARTYAEAERPAIFCARGLNQHSNSLQTNRAFHILAALRGNWGRPGAGVVNMAYSLPFGARAPAERVPPRRPGIRKSPVGWLEAMRSGRPYPIKALIMCNDPLSLWPEQRAVREAFSALEVIAYVGLFPTESSAYADFVFPAATGIEKGEVNRANDDRRLVWIDKLIDPPGEARPDGHFWVDLGKRFGFDDVLREEYKDSTKFWDEMMIGHPLVRGMSTARLKRSPTRWVRGPLPHEDDRERETLFLEGEAFPCDPEGRRFPTPSGKLELWTPSLEEKFNVYGLSALPEFYTDREQLVDLPHLEYETTDADAGVPSPFYENRLNANRARIVPGGNGSGRGGGDSAFDTELITGRAPAPHFHGWTHWVWQPEEMWPEMFCQIHPEKAQAVGVKDGEKVRVETAYGSFEAVAWVFEGIRKSSVFVPIGW